MENQTVKNPYYSRTDKTKLNVSNAETKPSVLEYISNNEQSVPIVVNVINTVIIGLFVV